MAQPPQNYDLTAITTTLILFVAAVFFWLCAKMIIGVVQWALGSANKDNSKQVTKPEQNIADKGEDEEEEEEEDEEEMPELETKKDN